MDECRTNIRQSGYSAALVVNQFGTDYWRYQIASPFILSLPVIGLYFVCVESPRWQIKKGMYRSRVLKPSISPWHLTLRLGQYRNAYNTLRLIRNSKIQASRDMFAIASQVLLEKKLLIDANSRLTTAVRCKIV